MTDQELWDAAVKQNGTEELHHSDKSGALVFRTPQEFAECLRSMAQAEGKRINAYKTLLKALQSEIRYHNERATAYAEAVNTLASERAANARLTEELETTKALLNAKPE